MLDNIVPTTKHVKGASLHELDFWLESLSREQSITPTTQVGRNFRSPIHPVELLKIAQSVRLLTSTNFIMSFCLNLSDPLAGHIKFLADFF